jgi:hypothetical protein
MPESRLTALNDNLNPGPAAVARRCGRRGRRAGRPGEALSAVTVSQACPTPAGRTRRARRGSGCGKLLCSGAALRHLGYRDFFQAPRCWLSYFCHSVRVTVTFGHLPEFSAEPRCCKSSLAMSWNSSSVQCRAGQDRQGWEGGRGGGSSGPSRCLPPQRAWRRATLSLSPSGTPVTALLSRAGRPAGRAGHDTEPAGYGLRRRPRPPQRPAEARQPVP